MYSHLFKITFTLFSFKIQWCFYLFRVRDEEKVVAVNLLRRVKAALSGGRGSSRRGASLPRGERDLPPLRSSSRVAGVVPSSRVGGSSNVVSGSFRRVHGGSGSLSLSSLSACGDPSAVPSGCSGSGGSSSLSAEPGPVPPDFSRSGQPLSTDAVATPSEGNGWFSGFFN